MFSDSTVCIYRKAGFKSNDYLKLRDHAERRFYICIPFILYLLWSRSLCSSLLITLIYSFSKHKWVFDFHFKAGEVWRYYHWLWRGERWSESRRTWDFAYSVSLHSRLSVHVCKRVASCVFCCSWVDVLPYLHYLLTELGIFGSVFVDEKWIRMFLTVFWHTFIFP